MGGARIEREGARVLLLDSRGRLLVLKGHDPHLVERTWWFTPGGGIEPGEGPREAAARELLEETGIAVAPESLVGPVWERTALFDFMSRPYVQHEWFFVAVIDDGHEVLDRSWTATEGETIDDVVWMAAGELAAAEIEVFPEELRRPWDFVDWDGVTRDLGEVSE